MSTDTNTQNPAVTLASLLADAGMSMSDQIRLTIAPSVVKSLSEGKTQVFVYGKDAKEHASVTTFVAAIADDATLSKAVTTMFEDATPQAIRAHVVSYCKSRKIPLVANATKGTDGILGYAFSRPTVK